MKQKTKTLKEILDKYHPEDTNELRQFLKEKIDEFCSNKDLKYLEPDDCAITVEDWKKFKKEVIGDG